MSTPAGKRLAGTSGGRTFRTGGAVLALLALPVALAAGCGDQFDQKFRQAALGSIETGVKSILDGVVSGIFAANHDTGSSASSSSSSGSSGSTSTAGTTASSSGSGKSAP